MVHQGVQGGILREEEVHVPQQDRPHHYHLGGEPYYPGGVVEDTIIREAGDLITQEEVDQIIRVVVDHRTQEEVDRIIRVVAVDHRTQEEVDRIIRGVDHRMFQEDMEAVA